MTDLNGFDLSGLVDSFKPDFSFHDQMMADMQREQNQMYESLRIQGEEKTRRNHLQDNANQAAIESKELLKEIAENTAYLKILVEINRETKLNGDELNYIMRAIYDVSKANNKEEADSLFAKALSKINDSGEFVGNVANLTNLLMGIYHTVSTINLN